MKQSKRILSIFLTLALALGLLALAPITASAAGPLPPNPTGDWDFRAVDANGSGSYGGGSWSWVQSSKTLTLNNLTFSTTFPTALFLPADATIMLSGTNKIESTHTGAGSSRAIWVGGNLTIQSDGSLTASTFALDGIGIECVSGGLTINPSGTVTAIGANGPCTRTTPYRTGTGIGRTPPPRTPAARVPNSYEPDNEFGITPAEEGETVLLTAYILRDNLPKYAGKSLMEVVGSFYDRTHAYSGYARDSYAQLGDAGIEDMIETIRAHAQEKF